MDRGILKISVMLCIVYAFVGCKSHKATTASLQAANNLPPQVILGDGKPVQTITLPIFIPAIELQNQLYQTFFAKNEGKYYPCSTSDDCSDGYKDLYVENPVIHIKDSLVAIKMHLGGVAHMLLDFNVSGDMMLTAIPFVKNDTLYFRNVTMQPSSQNLVTSIATGLFGKKITRKIQEKAWYSFRPKLDSTTTELKKKFPLKWGNICLLLNIKKIYLNKVLTQVKPLEGIVADFATDLTIETGDFCGQ